MCGLVGISSFFSQDKLNYVLGLTVGVDFFAHFTILSGKVITVWVFNVGVRTVITFPE